VDFGSGNAKRNNKKGLVLARSAPFWLENLVKEEVCQKWVGGRAVVPTVRKETAEQPSAKIDDNCDIIFEAKCDNKSATKDEPETQRECVNTKVPGGGGVSHTRRARIRRAERAERALYKKQRAATGGNPACPSCPAEKSANLAEKSAILAGKSPANFAEKSAFLAEKSAILAEKSACCAGDSATDQKVVGPNGDDESTVAPSSVGDPDEIVAMLAELSLREQPKPYPTMRVMVRSTPAGVLITILLDSGSCITVFPETVLRQLATQWIPLSADLKTQFGTAGRGGITITCAATVTLDIEGRSKQLAVLGSQDVRQCIIGMCHLRAMRATPGWDRGMVNLRLGDDRVAVPILGLEGESEGAVSLLTDCTPECESPGGDGGDPLFPEETEKYWADPDAEAGTGADLWTDELSRSPAWEAVTGIDSELVEAEEDVVLDQIALGRSKWNAMPVVPAELEVSNAEREAVTKIIMENCGKSTPAQRDVLTAVVAEFADTMNLPNRPLRAARDAECKFEVDEEELRKQMPDRPFRSSPRERRALQQTIQEFVKGDLWRPAPSTEWASRAMVIFKKQQTPKKLQKPLPDTPWMPPVCAEGRDTPTTAMDLIDAELQRLRFRIVQDLRKLNRAIKRNNFPLPTVEWVLRRVMQATKRSCFDKYKGFSQIEVLDERLQRLLAATTEFGLFLVLRMSQGLSVASGVFQEAMERAHAPQINDNTLSIYIDDDTIHTEAHEGEGATTLGFLVRAVPALEGLLEQHEADDEFLVHVANVVRYLMACRAKRHTLAAEKVKLFCDEVTLLGFVVGNAGIRIDAARIEGFLNFPRPLKKNDGAREERGPGWLDECSTEFIGASVCVTAVRRLLGSLNYFRVLIENFSNQAARLHEYTKTDAELVWDADAEAAFKQVLKAIAEAATLTRRQCGWPMVLETDWSRGGMGATLYQLAPKDPDNVAPDFSPLLDADGYPRGDIVQSTRALAKLGFERLPLAILSRGLTAPEKKLDVRMGECSTIVWALPRLRYFLYGARFAVLTGHSSLQFLMGSADVSSKISRWAIIIQQYCPRIFWKRGNDNIIPDAISRNPRARDATEEDVEDIAILAVDVCVSDIGDAEWAAISAVALGEADDSEHETLEVIAAISFAPLLTAKELETRLHRKCKLPGCCYCLFCRLNRDKRGSHVSPATRFNEVVHVDGLGPSDRGIGGLTLAIVDTDAVTVWREATLELAITGEAQARNLDFWVTTSGPPERVRADQQFNNDVCRRRAADVGAILDLTGPNEHHRMGKAERGHRVIVEPTRLVLLQLQESAAHDQFVKTYLRTRRVATLWPWAFLWTIQALNFVPSRRQEAPNVLRNEPFRPLHPFFAPVRILPPVAKAKKKRFETRTLLARYLYFRDGRHVVLDTASKKIKRTKQIKLINAAPGPSTRVAPPPSPQTAGHSATNAASRG